MANHWVFLADPEDFGWNELVSGKGAVWDGVKNPIAQRRMQECAVGDDVLIYHTSPDKAIIGIARVKRAAYPDPKAPERVVVDVEPVKPLARAVPMAELRADRILSELGFVKMARVAVHPVSDAQWQRVLEVSGTR